MRRPGFRVAVVLLALLLAGCDGVLQSRTARSLQRAEKEEADGDFRAAIASYEDAMDGTARTAEVHYRMALLYGNKLKDRVAALHHFQRYLELAPSAAHAKEAKAFMKETESELLNSSEGSLTQKDAAILKNENLRLVGQVNALHAQLADLRAQERTAPPKGDAGESAPIPAGSRTYVVQPGDTLASIARHFYKNSSRYKDIEDANYNRLGRKNKLKPGMTLIIP